MTVRIEADQDSGHEIPEEDEEVQTPRVVQHFTGAERAERGRAARAEVPRSSHAQLDATADRDPLGLLEEQAASRVPELVPIRYGRMLVSPFTFYRGAAAVMAHDLVPTPRAGLRVQLCGDAHLSNFGGFASPERSLVFDLNDFDETLPGPFEWDVKRLAASFEIAGRDRSFSDAERRTAVLSVLGAYRKAMRGFATMKQLELYRPCPTTTPPGGPARLLAGPSPGRGCFAGQGRTLATLSSALRTLSERSVIAPITARVMTASTTPYSAIV